MYLTTSTLALLLIGASFTGAATVVAAYLIQIRAWRRPQHSAGGRHGRPDHGADITYAAELAALRTSDVTPADPHPQGDVEVEGSAPPAAEGDINPATGEGSACDAADECVFDARCPFNLTCRQVVDEQVEIMNALAADVRAVAGYPVTPGRPVPPPVSPEFNYARPYVTGGGR